MATRRRVTPAAALDLKALSTVAVPSTVKKPSSNELLALVLGGSKIEVNIPESATLAEVEHSMTLALEGYRMLSDALERIKPIIGRHLLHVAQHRLYRPEYKGITEYIEARMEAVLGFSRTNSFEALRIAKGTPTMTVEGYQKYGATRLLAAVSIADEKDPQFRELLDKSLTMTTKAFGEYVQGLKAKRDGEPEYFTASVRLPLAYRETWERLLGDLGLSPGDLVQELIRSYIETHPATAPEPPLLTRTAGGA